MERAVLDGITLEHEVSGEGEPVVLIHGSFITDACRPLLPVLALTSDPTNVAYRQGEISCALIVL